MAEVLTILGGLYWRQPAWLLLVLLPLVLALLRHWRKQGRRDLYADRLLQAWVFIGDGARWD